MPRSTFLVSDVHGCNQELVDLLDKVNFDPCKIRLLVAGDLINRGEGSREVVKSLRSFNAECIIGNHEQRSIAYYMAELRRKETGAKNTIWMSSHKIDVLNSLDESDIIWLASLPTRINIADDWWMIHAGLENAVPFSCQSEDVLLRCRYLDNKGRMVKVKEQTPGTQHWSKAWDQPYSIIAGHQVVDAPVVSKNRNNTTMLIDTGCCFGNALTGFFFERNEFVQVKARKTYWKR